MERLLERSEPALAPDPATTLQSWKTRSRSAKETASHASHSARPSASCFSGYDCRMSFRASRRD